MTTIRTRRIIKRALWSLAVVLLLLGWYVCSYLGLQYLDGRGVIPASLQPIANGVCMPLNEYCETDLPGAEWLDGQRNLWHYRGNMANPGPGRTYFFSGPS